jgi:hypothetical protein
LITSAEHYDLDTLKAHGLNYTRFYPGAMFETIDKFITGNPLGPKSRDLVSSERLKHEDGNRQMTTPTYAIDISVRIKRLQ